MLLLLLVFALSTPVLDGDDFKSESKALEAAVEGGRTRTEREDAVARIGTFPGLAPTKLLVHALTESVSEQKSLDKVFADLTEEVADVLDGRVDIRLVGKKKKDLVEQRKQLGRRIIIESEICDKIIDALGARKDDESVEFFAKTLSRTRDWRMRSRLLEIIGKTGSELALPELHKMLGDKDARVRMFAVEAVGEIGAESSVDVVVPLLSDKEWQVRAFAVDAMGAIGETSHKVIPHLINALARETGRLQHELSEMLEKLTGQKHGLDAGPWQRWWTDNAATFGTPEELATRLAKASVKKSEGFSYYGIETKSDQVIFILDVSDSMNDDAGETELPPDGIPKRTGNLRPKIQIARDNLVQAILDLPGDAKFNIIVYNKYVSVWQPKLVKASKRYKNDAFEYVLNIKAQEATNIFDALELAFKFAGRFLNDRHYASPVDTIFFLTDGKATAGRIQDTHEILAEVKRINRLGKITIHTIGVGYLHDREFLKSLAEQNGGKYVNVQ